MQIWFVRVHVGLTRTFLSIVICQTHKQLTQLPLINLAYFIFESDQNSNK